MRRENNIVANGKSLYVYLSTSLQLKVLIAVCLPRGEDLDSKRC